MSGAKAAHHRGDYQKRAAKVRARANADASTTCWRCGLTLAQCRTKTGKPARWTAGHVIDSNPDSPLLPECSTCNYSAGAKLGNRRRQGLDPVVMW